MTTRPDITFPAPPLKFRTAGFPRYGFKLEVDRDLRRHPVGLRVGPPCPHRRPTYTRPKSRTRPEGGHNTVKGRNGAQAAPPAIPRDAPVQRPLARRRITRQVNAYMASSDALGPSRRLIFFVLAGLCPTGLSGRGPRGSPICSACRSLRAVVRTPADRAVAPGCCFTARAGLRHLRIGSASAAPPSPVPRWAA
jgi:hypothetical protein